MTASARAVLLSQAVYILSGVSNTIILQWLFYNGGAGENPFAMLCLIPTYVPMLFAYFVQSSTSALSPTVDAAVGRKLGIVVDGDGRSSCDDGAGGVQWRSNSPYSVYDVDAGAGAGVRLSHTASPASLSPPASPFVDDYDANEYVMHVEDVPAALPSFSASVPSPLAEPMPAARHQRQQQHHNVGGVRNVHRTRHPFADELAEQHHDHVYGGGSGAGGGVGGSDGSAYMDGTPSKDPRTHSVAGGGVGGVFSNLGPGGIVGETVSAAAAAASSAAATALRVRDSVVRVKHTRLRGGGGGGGGGFRGAGGDSALARLRSSVYWRQAVIGMLALVDFLGTFCAIAGVFYAGSGTYQVVQSSVVVVAALLYRVLLGRKLAAAKWLAVVIVCAGLATSVYDPAGGGGGSEWERVLALHSDHPHVEHERYGLVGVHDGAHGGGGGGGGEAAMEHPSPFHSSDVGGSGGRRMLLSSPSRQLLDFEQPVVRDVASPGGSGASETGQSGRRRRRRQRRREQTDAAAASVANTGDAASIGEKHTRRVRRRRVARPPPVAPVPLHSMDEMYRDMQLAHEFPRLAGEHQSHGANGGGSGAHFSHDALFEPNSHSRHVLGVAVTLVSVTLYALAYVLTEYALEQFPLMSSNRLCLETGRWSIAYTAAYMCVYTLPQWRALVVQPVLDSGTAPLAVCGVYALLFASGFLHQLSYYHMVAHKGGLAAGLAQGVRAVLVFAVSALVYCSAAHADQCFTAVKALSGAIVILGNVLFNLAEPSPEELVRARLKLNAGKHGKVVAV